MSKPEEINIDDNTPVSEKFMDICSDFSGSLMKSEDENKEFHSFLVFTMVEGADKNKFKINCASFSIDYKEMFDQLTDFFMDVFKESNQNNKNLN